MATGEEPLILFSPASFTFLIPPPLLSHSTFSCCPSDRCPSLYADPLGTALRVSMPACPACTEAMEEAELRAVCCLHPHQLRFGMTSTALSSSVCETRGVAEDRLSCSLNHGYQGSEPLRPKIHGYTGCKGTCAVE